jgi:hypothetical protein
MKRNTYIRDKTEKKKISTIRYCWKGSFTNNGAMIHFLSNDIL